MWDITKTEKFLKKAEAYGSILGLDSIQNLMEELGQVQDRLSIIHVAGTNGKGSVCTMLAGILCHAGYKIGKYSSPHVFCYEEKYQIDGSNITKEELAQVVREVKEACDRMLVRGLPHPTIFEIETAVAFLWFYKARCQVVVLETGLGGGTDATNVIRAPICCVFTSISMDHMGFLGEALSDIASVKAGIIKPHSPVVTVRQEEEVFMVLKTVCKQNHTKLILADRNEASNVCLEQGYLVFDWGNFNGIRLSMTGAYQVENAICAIETSYQLRRCGFQITDKTIVEGLFKAVWPGRFETILRDPLVVLDGAHNEGAAKKLRETLEMGFTNRKIIYIIGVLADKDHEKILQYMLPLADKAYTITPDHKRALDGKILCQEAGNYHNDVTYVPDMEKAAQLALSEAKGTEGSMVLVFGSLSYLGEMKKAIWKEAGI